MFMKQIIQNYSKKPDALFKLLYINLLFGYLPFAILHIILNLAGIMPVNFNDKQVFGLKGAIVIVIFIPFVALMFTVLVWVYFMIGNLVIRLIKKIFYS